MRKDVKDMVLGILNNNQDPTEVNKTFIALSQKGRIHAPKDFRSIVQCNVIMKPVIKTIVNRVTQVLPDIIDEAQSMFVKGILITNNTLIALECFHWMRKKMEIQRKVMTLKLDMSKVYDRIAWDFMEDTMEAIGFLEAMTKLIRRYIDTVSYQVLINDHPSKWCLLERGFRQGDPISPYLSVLCAYVILGILKRETEGGDSWNLGG